MQMGENPVGGEILFLDRAESPFSTIPEDAEQVGLAMLYEFFSCIGDILSLDQSDNSHHRAAQICHPSIDKNLRTN